MPKPFGRRVSFDHQRKQCGSFLAPESRHRGQASWRRKDSPDHQTARGFERGQRRPGMGEIPSFPGRAQDGHRAHDGQRDCVGRASRRQHRTPLKPKGNAPNAVDLLDVFGAKLADFRDPRTDGARDTRPKPAMARPEAGTVVSSVKRNGTVR